MIQYRANGEGGYIRVSDLLAIPADPNNMAYQRVQAELAAVPPLAEVLPYVPPPDFTDEIASAERLRKMRAASMIEDPKLAEALRLLGIL